MTRSYAQLIPLGARIDREMTYAVPDDLRGVLQVGHRVLIPLGARWTTGVVGGFQDETELDEVKSVGVLLDPAPALSDDMLSLCRWIAGYYLCSLSAVLKAALPAGIHTASGQRFALVEGINGDLDALSQTQRSIVEMLRTGGPAGFRQVERKLDAPGVRGAVGALVRQGIVEVRQHMAAPRVKPKLERTVELVPEDGLWFDSELPEIEKRAPKQGQCLRQLRDAGGSLPSAELRTAGIGSSIVRALSARNLVRTSSREVRRDPYAQETPDPPEHLTPTQHQQQALSDICGCVVEGRFETFLLRGVTGSGKTLVYIRAAAQALEAGKGALILVPEISLTPQTVRRFRAEFGDRVAVLHSALSDGERFDAWRDVRDGRRPVVVGAR